MKHQIEKCCPHGIMSSFTNIARPLLFSAFHFELDDLRTEVSTSKAHVFLVTWTLYCLCLPGGRTGFFYSRCSFNSSKHCGLVNISHVQFYVATYLFSNLLWMGKSSLAQWFLKSRFRLLLFNIKCY